MKRRGAQGAVDSREEGFMNTPIQPLQDDHQSSKRLAYARRASAFATLGGLLAFSLSAYGVSARNSRSAQPQQSGGDLYFNADASAKDVGLPIYPRARPHADKEDNKPSAKFGLWGTPSRSNLPC
jgi:hypothetical protein